MLGFYVLLSIKKAFFFFFVFNFYFFFGKTLDSSSWGTGMVMGGWCHRASCIAWKGAAPCWGIPPAWWWWFGLVPEELRALQHPRYSTQDPVASYLAGLALIGDGEETSSIPVLLLPSQAVEVPQGPGKAPGLGETPDPEGAESLGVGVGYFGE